LIGLLDGLIQNMLWLSLGVKADALERYCLCGDLRINLVLDDQEAEGHEPRPRRRIGARAFNFLSESTFTPPK